MPTKQKDQEQHALYLEAHPKSVKRALRIYGRGFAVVECRASDNARLGVDEHGKTTLIYTTDLDAGAHTMALAALTKQANIEQDHLLRDDEEDA